tara:strand:- start:431 stop:811 length:381 start_codon:yes stop_codon:yes gene_type:complete
MAAMMAGTVVEMVTAGIAVAVAVEMFRLSLRQGPMLWQAGRMVPGKRLFAVRTMLRRCVRLRRQILARRRDPDQMCAPSSQTAATSSDRIRTVRDKTRRLGDRLRHRAHGSRQSDARRQRRGSHNA